MPAEAATPRPGTFKATKIQLGYTMTFKVKGSRITDLVARVLERCDGSTTTTQTTIGPGLSWRIRGGRFSKRIKETQDGVTLYTTLEGRFTSPGKAVRDDPPGVHRRRLDLRHAQAEVHRDPAVTPVPG